MSSHTFSPQSTHILDLLEHGTSHLFITGKAGTGKSTLLQHFRLHTKIPLVVLAPTGVAAVHIGGETIHSFFRFAPNVTKKEARSDAYFCEDRTLYKKLEMIIIDEISMVRSDLLDCVDVFLRTVRDDEEPFGGVRLVFFGDLYQLPPVVTSSERLTFRSLYPSEWFFDSGVMRSILQSDTENFLMYELDTIYRQHDKEFIALLAAVRMRTAQDHHLEKLNQQVKDPETTKQAKKKKSEDHVITLTGRRDTAARINQEHLDTLSGTPRIYEATHHGTFPDGHLPTGNQLTLKVGARVMFVANDPEGMYVNGTLGTVKKLHSESVIVQIDGGKAEEIVPHTWELTHTVLSNTQELEKEKVGDFTQLPLMLAWAVTIHKAQGKTFDQVHINLENGAFAHGQVYVALSRCKTLEGITLTQPLTLSDIKMNIRVNQFFLSYMIQESNRKQSREEKFQRIQDAIEMGTHITIAYLKKIDEESRQIIQPLSVGQMTHEGRPFVGVTATTDSGNILTFNAEKILQVF